MKKNLELTPEEQSELLAEKQKKANSLLLDFIHAQDEKQALKIAFDNTLEVNANIEDSNYKVLYEAISENLFEFVKESFLKSDIKDTINTTGQNNSILHLNLMNSNNPEMYDFIESNLEKKGNKFLLLGHTLFLALNSGKLNLIKHLIDKKLEGQYRCIDHINMKVAVVGYSSIKINKKTRNMDNLFEYTSYFADIENQTQNTYINSETKKGFFNDKLLTRIMSRYDDRSLNLYIQIVSPQQIIKDISSCIENHEEEIKNGNRLLIEHYKWLFLNLIEHKINCTLPQETIDILKSNEDLMKYYENIQLTYKIQNKLPEKEIHDKRLKL